MNDTIVAKYKDLTGKKFGGVTILYYTSMPHRTTGKRVTVAICKCDCGKEFIAWKPSKLVSGLRKSCGCRKHEKEKKVYTNKKKMESLHSLRNMLYQHYKQHRTTFDITKEHFNSMISSVCFYCGRDPYKSITHKSSGVILFYTGVDRLDSTQGYTVSNTVPCCIECNIRKSNTQADVFIKWASMVFENTQKTNAIQCLDERGKLAKSCYTLDFNGVSIFISEVGGVDFDLNKYSVLNKVFVLCDDLDITRTKELSDVLDCVVQGSSSARSIFEHKEKMAFISFSVKREVGVLNKYAKDNDYIRYVHSIDHSNHSITSTYIKNAYVIDAAALIILVLRGRSTVDISRSTRNLLRNAVIRGSNIVVYSIEESSVLPIDEVIKQYRITKPRDSYLPCLN